MSKFVGWVADGAGKNIVGSLKLEEFEPKPFEEEDIDIEIIACGLCGSDLHSLNGDWSDRKNKQIVGHEIVGKAIRVGKEAKGFKVGDIVGVGAQCDSCGSCEQCSKSLEQYCTVSMVQTYNGQHCRGPYKGTQTWGGYANMKRANWRFCFKIPDNVKPEDAASALCAGATVYQPLLLGGAKGKSVAVIGLGGLGHWAVLLGKAMGVKDLAVVTHSKDKVQAAKDLGADRVLMSDELVPEFDFLIMTSNDKQAPIEKYMGLLKPGGQFFLLGVSGEPLPSMAPAQFVFQNKSLCGSLIASPSQIRDMLDLISKNNIKPVIEKRPMSSVNETLKDMEAGKARFRYVFMADYK